MNGIGFFFLLLAVVAVWAYAMGWLGDNHEG